MRRDTFLQVNRQAAQPDVSGNGGIIRMDILFELTRDAIGGVAAAVLTMATNIPRSSPEKEEAEAKLREAMAHVSGRVAGDGRRKVRCRVSYCEGRTTVTLLNPEREASSAVLSRPQPGFTVYSDRGCSIQLVDELQRQV